MEIIRCFEILEILPGSSPEEIRSAYRDLVQVWHPDRFMHSNRLQEKAAEKLKRVNAAYAVLTGTDPAAGELCETGSAAERRLHPRKPCALPVLHYRDGLLGGSLQDKLQDISASGALLISIEPLTSGQHLSLTFTLPRLGQLRGLKCQVIWTTQGGGGIRFNISPRYRKLLSSLI